MALVAFVAVESHAQTPGTIRLFIEPGNNFAFVLDGKHRMQQREVTLPGGPHRFQFWAPTRKVVDTTLAVFPDRTVDFTLRLPFSDEYKMYQAELEDYQRYRLLRRTVPMAVTGLSAVVSVALFSKYKKAHEQLEEDVAQYAELTSPGGIANLKDKTMPEHQDAFKKAQNNFIVSASVTGALAAVTAYLFVKSGARKGPIFEDKERVKFNGLAWVPNGNGGYWSGGLTINLAKR